MEVSICKHASSTAEFPIPYSPVGRNCGDNTGNFHTAGNEVMKPILLLFNGFHSRGIFQFAFNFIQYGRRGECKRVA